MKTNVLMKLALVPFILFSSCKGQTNKSEHQPGNTVSSGIYSQNQNDTANAPRYNIKVNKQYDDSGHLIKYDSSYSYTYSSAGGMNQIKDDSIYKKFSEYFQKNYSPFFNSPLNGLFYRDSLFKYDFFNNDYFMKRFEMNNDLFEKMYRRMDSIKNSYMQRNYPNGKQKKG